MDDKFPVGLVSPDERGRFPLKRYMTAEPVQEWRLYRSKDGRTLTLEAVVR